MSSVLCLGIILPLFFTSCANKSETKPPEFFLIEDKYDGESQFFVIADAPKDPEEIRRIIEDYNKRTIPLDKLSRTGEISRTFYCETALLTRNFKEGESYPNGGIEGGFFDGMIIFSGERQELRNHVDALLARIYFIFTVNNYWIYNYTYLYINGKKSKKRISQRTYISDINAYFAGDPQSIIRVGKKE